MVLRSYLLVLEVKNMRLPKVDELRPELVFLTAARHWCRNRTAIHSPAVFTPRSRICLKMNDLWDLANYRTEMMHTVLASYDVKIQNPGKIKNLNCTRIQTFSFLPAM